MKRRPLSRLALPLFAACASLATATPVPPVLRSQIASFDHDQDPATPPVRAVRVAWTADPGTTCFLQQSSDLAQWQYLPEVFAGTGAEHSLHFPVGLSDSPLRKFFRVLAATTPVGHPADTDGDGLQDTAELAVFATDPLAADTDGDGIEDGAEIEFGLNPVDSDSDDDLIPDGQENLDPRWFELLRDLDYTFPADAPGSGGSGGNTVVPHGDLYVHGWWPAGPSLHEEPPSPLPFDSLSSILQQLAPWPQDPGLVSQAALFVASGCAEELSQPFRQTAALEHRRNTVRLPRAAAEDVHFQALLVTERSINGVPSALEIDPVETVVPAGQRQSVPPVDLTPSFVGIGGSGAYQEIVTRKQVNVFFEVPEVDPVSGNETGRWIRPTELKIGKLRGGEAVNLDVIRIGLDVDRFRVVVENAGLEAAPVACSLKTTHAEAAYADASNQVAMQFDSGRGAWVTKAQLLVSDTVDDLHSQSGQDYEGEEIGADESPGDRTHIAMLGGQVVIDSVTYAGQTRPVDHKLPVKVKGTLKLDILNMRQDGQTAVLPAQIERDVKAARERYAQIGVKVEAGPVTVVDVPEGVDMLDLHGIEQGTYRTVQTEDGPKRDYQLSNEEKALLDGINHPAGPDEVVVIYVRGIWRDSPPEEEEYVPDGPLAATSFPPFECLDPSETTYRHHVLVAKIANLFCMIHEVTHAVGNLQHDGSTNLMNQNVQNSTNTAVDDAKRLSRQQEAALRSGGCIVNNP